MDAQQQQQQGSQPPGQAQGGQAPQQQQPGITNPDAQQGAVQGQGQGGQIGGALDSILGHLNKSETEQQKKLADQYKDTIERFSREWERDVTETTNEILFTLANKKKSKKK
jgi:hypothetical protein